MVDMCNIQTVDKVKRELLSKKAFLLNAKLILLEGIK